MNPALLLLADEIKQACTTAVLDWGEAICRAEASPNDAALKLRAQRLGGDVARLAAGLSAKVRPVKR